MKFFHGILFTCQIICLYLFNLFVGIRVEDLCQNGGKCENVGNSHICRCKVGYEGSYCQHEINECASRPCYNGATCNDLIGLYSCSCRPGFTGKYLILILLTNCIYFNE